ncbi:MAG: hypothetical protein HY204_00575 [Nitrospirae bacterium]|nr:hypothetical protein [Nitrospirota bacterium]
MKMKNVYLIMLGWIFTLLTVQAGHSKATAVSAFTVQINGTPYTRSEVISPTLPIIAVFYHPDPNVTTIRMQFPADPGRRMTFPLGRPVRLVDPEMNLKEGKRVQSEFVAVDELGNEYDKISLTFVPGQ